MLAVAAPASAISQNDLLNPNSTTSTSTTDDEASTSSSSDDDEESSDSDDEAATSEDEEEEESKNWLQQGLDAVTGGVGDAVSSVAGSAFANMVGSFAESSLQMLITMMTFWAQMPSNVFISAAEPDGNSLISQVHEYTSFIQIGLGIASVMFVGLKFGLGRARDLEETAQDSMMTIGRIMFTSAMWVPIVVLATQAGDAFSAWVIEESSNSASEAARGFVTGVVEENWSVSTAWMYAATASSGGWTAIVLLVAILVIITSVIQLVLLYVRMGFLIILAAIMPVIAAAGGLENGKEAWGKAKAWTIALILFKPAAALVYAIAFWTIGNIEEDDTEAVLGALIIMSMAVLVLPSLVALIAPPAAQAPQGGSGMKVAAGMAAAGAMVATKGKMGGGATGPSSRHMAGSSMGGGGGSAGGGGGGGGGGFRGGGGGGGG